MITAHTTITSEDLAKLGKVLLQPDMVLAGMALVPKACFMIILLAGFIALAAAAIRRATGGPRLGVLTAMGWIAPGFGIAGALYGGLNIFVGMQAVGAPYLVVIAPGIIEIVYCLGAAAIVWIISRVGNAGVAQSRLRDV